ncbi:MAG: DUF983 domain-containing protein [Terricaulis sp.]
MSGRPSAWAAGVQMRCPECGKGPVFGGYLRFRDKCPACGADFRVADAGDGPAVFIILIVGAIVTPLLIVLQFGLHLPSAVALGITIVAAILLCLALLPPFKATMFALQWKHKASEATNRDVQ